MHILEKQTIGDLLERNKKHILWDQGVEELEEEEKP